MISGESSAGCDCMCRGTDEGVVKSLSVSGFEAFQKKASARGTHGKNVLISQNLIFLLNHFDFIGNDCIPLCGARSCYYIKKNRSVIVFLILMT